MRENIDHYLSSGFVVFPVPYGSKSATLKNWSDPNKRWTADDFPPETNIALRMDHLVDIDPDDPIARQLCAKWLPKTARYGRPSGAVPTHYLYRTEAPVDKLEITDGTDTIIEIRTGPGQYSIAPPSRLFAEKQKPEDVLAWMDDDPAHPVSLVPSDSLIQIVKVIGTIAILAKHWPATSRRHVVSGMIAGLLCRILPESETFEDDLYRIIEEAATHAGDEQVRDRLAYAKTTYQRWQKREPVKGGPSLAKEIGDTVVHALYNLWGYQRDQQDIDHLNEKHAVLFSQSGQVVVLTETMEDGDWQIRFSKPSDMGVLYPQLVVAGFTAKGTPTMKPLGDVWVTHPRRRFYRGIELAPGDTSQNEGYYNLWRGFSVEPKKGDWSLFNEQLSLVANHDPDSIKFILDWMAETVQHPERPIGVALAFRGQQGTGKSSFAKWFGRLFGAHFLHLDSEYHLTGNFNAHLHNKVVVLADEAVWAGGKAGLGVLKRMITEDTLNIERKGVDVITVKNRIHMMVASNEDWAVPADWDNRRFAVFDTAPDHANDKKFFAAVSKQLFHHGGLAALLYDLQEHVVENDFTDIPETSALAVQKMRSAKLIDQWWMEKLRYGKIGEGNYEPENTWSEDRPDWPKELSKEKVHEDYIAFIDKHHRASRNPRDTESELGRFMREYLPGDKVDIRRYREKAAWLLPALDDCRQHWLETHGITSYEWPQVDVMADA